MDFYEFTLHNHDIRKFSEMVILMMDLRGNFKNSIQDEFIKIREFILVMNFPEI